MWCWPRNSEIRGVSDGEYSDFVNKKLKYLVTVGRFSRSFHSLTRFLLLFLISLYHLKLWTSNTTIIMYECLYVTTMTSWWLCSWGWWVGWNVTKGMHVCSYYCSFFLLFQYCCSTTAGEHFLLIFLLWVSRMVFRSSMIILFLGSSSSSLYTY